jgi:hypothetical protein
MQFRSKERGFAGSTGWKQHTSPKGLNVNSPERKLGVYEPKINPTLKGLNYFLSF